MRPPCGNGDKKGRTFTAPLHRCGFPGYPFPEFGYATFQPPVLCKGVFCYINLIFYAIKILNMKITESHYMNYAVIPDLRKEIMQCICSIKQVDALSFAKQIDKKFSESICLFVHTIVIGETVYVIDSKGNNLVEIDTTEMVTNCCSASMVDETDICSACKEHASLVPAET